MRKIDKKGFTLVEVLAVVTILGILVLLVTVGILGYLQHGKDDYNEKLKGQLLLAGKTYYASNKEELPTSVNGKAYSYVTLPTIQSNNYIEKSFVDSEGRECSPSFVYVKQKANNSQEYEYYPCLICQGDDNQQINYSKDDSKYCDPANWDKNEAPSPEPEPTDGEGSCSYTKTETTLIVTQATMPKGILKIYYIDDEGNEHLVYDGSSTNETTISNITQEGVGEFSDLYVEDKEHNQKICNEVVPQPETPVGAPVCSITAIDSWIKKQFTVHAECHGQNGNPIKLGSSYKSKITVTGGHGTIANKDKSYEQVSDSIIKFSMVFKAKSNSEGRDTLKLAEGIVENVNDKQVNVVTSSKLKVDNKKPNTIFYRKGTTRKASAKKDKGKGYKNSVQVSIKCTDAGSGVASFSVNGKSVTVGTMYEGEKKTERGKYTYKAVCKDKAGNEQNEKHTYRVLKYERSCSKCGWASSRCVNWVNRYYIKHLAYGAIQSSCSRSTSWLPSASQCGSHTLGMLTHRCVVVSGGYRQETGSCSSYSDCTKWKCTKGKYCWY